MNNVTNALMQGIGHLQNPLFINTEATMKQLALYVCAILLAPTLFTLTGCDEAGQNTGHGHDHDHDHLSQTTEGEHPHTTPDGIVYDDDLEITDAMLDEIDDYLTMLTYGLIDLSNNQEFIDVLNTEIDKQFDEDDNVLFKDLKAACTDADIDLEAEMNASILAHAPADIRALIDDLPDVLDKITYEGQGFYPQVYFPFADDEDVETSDAPTAILPVTSDVYDVGDEISGLQPTINTATGAVTGFSPVTIDEDDASTDIVWVVSINERVNYKGTLELVYQKNKKSTACPPTKWFEFYPEMEIKDRKESWFSGKTEVYFGFSQYDPFTPHDVTRWTNEKKIKVLSRKDYDDANKNPFDLHLEFTNDWAWCDGKIALIIYERDKPAKKKKWTYESTLAMEFQSKQSEYWKGHFNESNYINTGPWQGTQTNHSNSSIEFTMRGREN